MLLIFMNRTYSALLHNIPNTLTVIRKLYTFTLSCLCLKKTLSHEQLKETLGHGSFYQKNSQTDN